MVWSLNPLKRRGNTGSWLSTIVSLDAKSSRTGCHTATGRMPLISEMFTNRRHGPSNLLPHSSSEAADCHSFKCMQAALKSTVGMYEGLYTKPTPTRGSCVSYSIPVVTAIARALKDTAVSGASTRLGPFGLASQYRRLCKEMVQSTSCSKGLVKPREPKYASIISVCSVTVGAHRYSRSQTP